MAEPNTTTFVLAGAVAAALGPVLGPSVLIAFGAVAGSMLALSKVDTGDWRAALKFILVGVLIAIAITGSAAWALDRWMGVPINVSLMPVAAIIGAARNSLLELMQKLLDVVASIARVRGGGQ